MPPNGPFLRGRPGETIELSGTDRGFVVLVSGENLEDATPIFLRLSDGGDEHEAARSLVEIGAPSVACAPLVRSRHARPLSDSRGG